MHTVSPAGSSAEMEAETTKLETTKPAMPPGSGRAVAGKLRVAVAGATGYTGQELLRLLARHPSATITAATSSGAAAARALPALARVWDGSVTPLDADALPALADVVFLALPDTAAAALAPRLVE